MRVRRFRLLPVLASIVVASPVQAEQSGDGTPPGTTDEHELAKKLANPVADLISVPLQENMDTGSGHNGGGFKSVFNIQPVVPIGMGKVNLIVCTILPLVYQDKITGPSEEQFGLGDTTQSFFVSPVPRHPGDLIWAIGPVGYYPTATVSRLGTGKWGAGITGLVLKQSGKNTIGLLPNRIWSVAGDSTRANFSSLFLQPILSHTTRSAMTNGINAEATYDWKHDQWVVPINLSHPAFEDRRPAGERGRRHSLLCRKTRGRGRLGRTADLHLHLPQEIAQFPIFAGQETSRPGARVCPDGSGPSGPIAWSDSAHEMDDDPVF
jgi:hypothetical protein